MQLDQILYFIDPCESNSLAESAKHFYISPQGFRKSITSLENELGIRLVQVANHRLLITEAGREYYNRVKAPVSEIVSIHQGLFAHFRHSINVGVSTGVLSMVVNLFTEFERENACTLHIFEHPDKIIERKLASGEVQVAFITGPILTSGLIHARIRQEPSFFCVPVDSALASRASLDFSAIIGQDYVTMNEEHKIYDCYERNLSRLDAPMQIVFKADSIQSLNQMVDAGRGIAISNVQYPIVSDRVRFIPSTGHDWQLNIAVSESCRDQLALRFYQWVLGQPRSDAR